MGKNKTPSYNPPAAPKLPTAEELFASGTNWAKTNAPVAYGAREQALQDVNDPNYYSKFQPTSFEQALGNQYFSNVWPDQEKAIRNQLSLTGMADSPVSADVLGRALGKTQFDIGSYLSNLGNERAVRSLDYRNIDPMGLITPFVNVGMSQGNAQAQADYEYQQQLAQVAYQQAIDKYNKQNQMMKMIGMFSPVGGAVYGGVKGGVQGLGQSLSGTMDMGKYLASMGMSGGIPGIPGMPTGGTDWMGNMANKSVSVNPTGGSGSFSIGNMSNSDIMGQYLNRGN